MASSKAMRGNGTGVTVASGRNSANTPCSTGASAAKTSSWVTNNISTWSWEKPPGGAGGPAVLGAEARGDLEVPVEAGHHQQLLELLGGLRQRVELAGVHAGRHQIVSGAPPGGRRQDRG